LNDLQSPVELNAWKPRVKGKKVHNIDTGLEPELNGHRLPDQTWRQPHGAQARTSRYQAIAKLDLSRSSWLQTVEEIPETEELNINSTKNPTLTPEP
jgi:hypothetical protein